MAQHSIIDNATLGYHLASDTFLHCDDVDDVDLKQPIVDDCNLSWGSFLPFIIYSIAVSTFGSESAAGNVGRGNNMPKTFRLNPCLLAYVRNSG